MRRKRDDASGARPEFWSGFGRALKVLRAQRGLERKQLAELSGLSYPYVSDIESGRKRPSSRAIVALAGALGMAPNRLVAVADEADVVDEAAGGAFSPPSRRGEVFASPRRDDLSVRAVPLAPPAPRGPPVPGDRAQAMLELERLAARLTDDDLERILDLARRLARA